jgi:hypothetical protein
MNIIELPVNSVNLTVDQVCDAVKSEKPTALLCIGYIDGELMIRSANRLSRADSLWLLEVARRHVLEPLDEMP